MNIIVNHLVTIMPKLFYYQITITFKPTFKSSIKYDYISRMPQEIMKKLLFKYDGELTLVVEYHKYTFGPLNGQNNVTRPHVHGVLQTTKPLSQYVITHMALMFKDKYGRSDFFPMEDEYTQIHWGEYILKDIEANNIAYPTYIHKVVLPVNRVEITEDYNMLNDPLDIDYVYNELTH